MSPQAALAIFAAGLAAGTVNVIVGSGSLITFPTLLALGYPPVLANVSNTVGLVPGSISATVAYRRELVGQRPRLVQLGSASVLGGLTGAVLLLGLPHSVFKAAVPALVALAAVLMAAQPRVRAALERRGPRQVHGGGALLVGVFLTGSDTSSNALFGSLQVVTATRLGMNPVLMAAANSSGGVMGKMVSLASIAVAAAATNMKREDEAKLFRFTIRHSVFLASVIGIVVLFYAYVAPSLAP